MKLGANLDTFMNVFYINQRIGFCPIKDDKRITCDNLSELPKNYKIKVLFGIGANNPVIQIDEFSLKKPDICIEKYSIFLVLTKT